MKTLFSNILIVGGNARLIGKTTMVCMLLKEFSKKNNIIGLKVVTHYKDDGKYEDKKKIVLTEDFTIIKEENRQSHKGTSLMLRAGASASFLIRCKYEFINEAFNAFQQRIEKNSVIICESNSIANYIKPGVFLIIKNRDKQDKSNIFAVEKYADKIIYTDEKTQIIDEDFSDIKLTKTGWKIKY